MPATPIRGKPIADRIRAQVAEEVRRLDHVGLVTVLVGDDPASEIYIGLKQKASKAAGIDATDVRLPADISEDDLLARVAELNADDAVDALLVQLPLPAQIDESHEAGVRQLGDRARVERRDHARTNDHEAEYSLPH